MYLKYGNYTHDHGEVTLSAIACNSKTGDAGVVESIVEQWVLDGRLQIADQGSVAANQAAMTTALNALQNAYATNGRDIGFYDDSGNLTSHSINSSATVFGTRIVAFQYPAGAGAEYSTYRSYRIVVEADWLYTAGGGGGKLTSWTESISFTGTGRPTWGLMDATTGKSQPQIFTEASRCHAVQSGRATQSRSYPIPGGPLWGEPPEHSDQRTIAYDVAVSDNNVRGVNWTYIFEANSPLIGYPRFRNF